MRLQRGISIAPAISKSFLKLVIGGQIAALALSPWLALSCSAQSSSPSTSTSPGRPLLSQLPGTILPTDVVPLPAAQERMSFGENLQLRMLQRLPARFYFNASCETSFRLETNPLQFPDRHHLTERLIGKGRLLETLPPNQQEQIFRILRLVDRTDHVFRALPNVTAGWTITPRTRVFANYFLIRDWLFRNRSLSTTIQSVAGGIQQDIPVTRRGNLQLEFQARSLFQEHAPGLFDFLPGATFSYIATPRTVLFLNALLQMRGLRYFQAPTRELDPFYTFGFLHQRGGWSFSNTATFVQNFREIFGNNASIREDNYSWICDFEIARRLVKAIPGLQAFVRAEPIWNFNSHYTPGLAGFDFRLFYGLRMAVGKPPLTAALEQIRQQLEEQEGTPPPAVPPGKQPGEPKPSAYLMPYQVTAGTPQPIHGYLAPIIQQPHDELDQPVNLAIFHGQKPDSEVASSTAIAEDTTADILDLTQTTSSQASASSASTFAPNSSAKVSGAAIQSDKAPSSVAATVNAVVPKIEPNIKSPTPAIAATVNQTDDTSLIAAKPDTQSPSAQIAEKSSSNSVEPESIDLDNQSQENAGAETIKVDQQESVSDKKDIKKKASRLKKNLKRTKSISPPNAAGPAKVTGKQGFQMILMPPLPSVRSQSRENPFQDSGLKISPPIMMNVVR